MILAIVAVFFLTEPTQETTVGKAPEIQEPTSDQTQNAEEIPFHKHEEIKPLGVRKPLWILCTIAAIFCIMLAFYYGNEYSDPHDEASIGSRMLCSAMAFIIAAAFLYFCCS